MATADDMVDALGYSIATFYDRAILQILNKPWTREYEIPQWQTEFERRIQC